MSSTGTSPEVAFGEAFDTTAAQLRGLSERVFTGAKKAGTVALDVHESTFKAIADYTEKLGASSPIEPVASMTRAQANLTRELTGVYTKAARSLLD